ncbi:MAG: GNAT family N-acetyltransferase [Nocardioidaceae bacterium]
MPAASLPTISLVPLSSDAVTALAERDFARADADFGAKLPPIVRDNTWLWRLRRDQLRTTPDDVRWVARVFVDHAGTVIGHAGFHGGPDESGMVEVGYSVDTAYRGRGFAKAALAALIDWARSEPDVHTLRATVSPDNAPSLAIVCGAGLVENGEQWDERDGIELIFEMPVPG